MLVQLVGRWSTRTRRGVVAVLVGGLLLTVVAVTLVARELQEDLQADLEALVLDTAGRLATRIGIVDQTLVTLGAELRVDEADIEQFTEIVDDGQLVERTIGVQSLSVAREYPVPGPDRAATGGTSLIVERIVPIELDAQLDGELDLYARGTERQRATTAARDSGGATATAPLELAYGGTGILYYSPVFLEDAATEAARRASFLGVAIAVVDPPALFAGLLGPEPLVDVVVADLGPVDADPVAAVPVWRSAGTTAADVDLTASTELVVADRRWQLTVSPTPRLLPSDLAVVATGVGGVLLSLALAALAAAILGARDRAEHLVELRTSELRTAYQLQSQFVSTVSHELRTPLAAVLGFIETVRTHGHDERLDTDDMLARAERQGRQLDRMIGELLDFGRIERGQVNLDPVPTDLAEVVPRLLTDLDPVVGDRGVTLEVDAADGAPALVDRDALARVLGNLLENAARYAPGDTPIEVGVGADDTTVWVTVVDDGPGIDAADAPFVFERFYRGRGQMGMGTGIGLAVVRQLVEGHEGTVTLTSRAGGGTVARVVLPRH